METINQQHFQTIGICGGGKMGLSFFNHIFPFNDNIVFYIRNSEKLASVSSSHVKRHAAAGPGRVCFTGELEELAGVDIVFEFIAEDLEEKKALLGKLSALKKNPEQVLATGSSSLTPGRLSKSYRAKNIIGVHYIYPVQYMKTVEVIYGKDTGQDVIDSVRAFLLATGKQPLILDEEAGSITTKVLINLQNEAYRIYREQGISPRYIDEIVEQEEFALSPFGLTDSVGHDVIRDSIIGHFGDREEAQRFEDFKRQLELNTKKGCLGRKSGKGFLDLDGREVTDESIQQHIAERLKMVYINACLKFLDGCKTTAEELDRVFCELNRSEKGPVEMAFEYGMINILETLERLSSEYGPHFRPTKVMRYAAENGTGRDEIDRQIRVFGMGGKRPDWHPENIG